MATFALEHLYRPAADTSKKAPLIIMLHGYGSDMNDLFSFASELPEEYAILSVQAPHAMQPYGNAWYAIHWDQVGGGKFNDIEQAVASRELLGTFIEQALEEYPVDRERVALIGFSQGTILSFAYALSHPQQIKCVVGLSGYIVPEMYAENYRENDFSGLKVYSSHGSVDAVIPVDWARKTPGFLDELGISNVFSEFPVGHRVAPQNFYEFKAWLEENL
ncbi:alpha/beta fold hydrolase [Gilvibacter sp.]|uniref:alpha/beta hydrolase n=1 Tax=Gilvibacter sp. TaxID=2729997 RepID=UPI0025BA687F|nr:alpha/beta fold hydrolase [Gilvibacter sp.]NQX77239.1 alpha/beta fold hydrolase [Gilvibacter sp.]